MDLGGDAARTRLAHLPEIVWKIGFGWGHEFQLNVEDVRKGSQGSFPSLKVLKKECCSNCQSEKLILFNGPAKKISPKMFQLS